MLSPADRARIAALVDEGSAQDSLSRAAALCGLCLQVTGGSGVALSVAGCGSRSVTSTVYGTDALSLRLEELQLGLAEGPIADALESTLPVLESNLRDTSHPRWMWFAPAAVGAGAAAVFVLPLCEGETPLGALSLYYNTMGDLTAEQYDDFSAMADAAVEIVLATAAESPGETGSWTVGAGTAFQPEVHQAVGVLMVALGVEADDALARMRGYAFAAEKPISEVAHEIVVGRLRLEDDAA